MEESARDLLVRIDERVKAIQIDIKDINETWSCASHGVKIRNLERMVWGCLAGLAGLGVRIIYSAIR